MANITKGVELRPYNTMHKKNVARCSDSPKSLTFSCQITKNNATNVNIMQQSYTMNVTNRPPLSMEKQQQLVASTLSALVASRAFDPDSLASLSSPTIMFLALETEQGKDKKADITKIH